MAETYKPLDEPAFEPSVNLRTIVEQIDAEIESLENRVAELKSARRGAIDTEARSNAKLKADDRVRAIYRRKLTDFVVSHVSGRWFEYEDQRRIIINYSGHPIKKDGSFGDRQNLNSIKVKDEPRPSETTEGKSA